MPANLQMELLYFIKNAYIINNKFITYSGSCVSCGRMLCMPITLDLGGQHNKLRDFGNGTVGMTVFLAVNLKCVAAFVPFKGKGVVFV